MIMALIVFSLFTLVCVRIRARYEDKGLNISDYLVNRKSDLVITTPVEGDYTERECSYCISRKAIDFNIPTILNMGLGEALTEVIEQRRKGPFRMKSWNGYFA
jgi:hypothetical protein